jgi:hypothetical protein
MFKFSHTALKGPDEQNGVVAVFALKSATTPLATAFNLKTDRSAYARMSLVQMDFRLATSGDDEKVGELKMGRAALKQRQRYEGQKIQHVASESVSNG